jgi:hypothetical protein
MSERLVLNIDFQHAKAAQGAATVNAQLDQMKQKQDAVSAAAAVTAQKMTDVQKAVDEWYAAEERAAAGAKKLGDNAEEAATKAKTGATAAAAATNDLARATDKATKEAAELGAKHDEAGKKGKRGADEAKGALDALSKTTRGLVDDVKSWAGSYFTLQAALKLINEIDEAAKKAMKARDDLVGQKVTRNDALARVQENLNLFGTEGQAKARAMVEQVRKDTTLPFEQSAMLISAMASSGVDATKSKGAAQSQTMVGQFAASTKLDPHEVELLTRLIAQKGIGNDPAKVGQFLGMFFQASNASGQTRAGDFVKAAIGSLGDARQKGMDDKESLAYLAAFTGTSGTAERGAERFRMAMTVAEASSPKMRAFFASQAAATGMTRPGTVSMADIEAGAAAGDEDKKGMLDRVQGGQVRLARMEEDVANDEKDLANLQADREFVKLQARDPNDAARILREKRLAIARKREDIKEARADKDRTAAAAVKAEQDRRNIAAFNTLPESKRLQLVQSVLGSQDPKVKQTVADEMAGLPEQKASAAAMSQAGFRAKQAAAGAAIGASGGAAMVQKNYRQYRETADKPAMEAVADASVDAAVDTGKEFETFFIDNMVEPEFKIYSGEATWQDKGQLGVGAFPSDDNVKALIARDRALYMLGALWQQLSPEERTKHGGLFEDIGKGLNSFDDGFIGSTSLRNVRNRVRQIGYIRADVNRDRKKAGKAGLSDPDLPKWRKDAVSFRPGFFSNPGSAGGVSYRVNTADQMGSPEYNKSWRVPGASVPRSYRPDSEATPSFLAPPGEGGAMGPSDAAAPLTGQMAVASAAPTFNITVGNWFNQGGTDGDLAGRLEAIG